MTLIPRFTTRALDPGIRAYVDDHVVRERLRIEAATRLLMEYEEQHGPITVEEQATFMSELLDR